jgi:hypothetical protein
MTFLRLLADGFRAARRHPGLVLVSYLVPLVPAVVLAAMAHGTLAPVFDYSLLAQRVLDGTWNSVWRDFTASPANHLSVILGPGITWLLVLTALIQIPVAAGISEVLIEGDAAQGHPFFAGIAQNTWRYARAALWFLVAAGATAIACSATVRGFFKLAEHRADARFDIYGVFVAAALAVALGAIFVPAYDLARLAAARHDDRKTFRGFFRAIWTVLRHPGLFLPLVVSFVVLTAGLHLGYYAVRGPLTPATAAGIVALFVAQQLVMVVRAVFHVAFWGAELAAYRHLDEPRLCEKRQRKLIVVDEPVAPEPVADEPAPAPPEPPAPAAEDVFDPSPAS